jgi:hypothetical protein
MIINLKQTTTLKPITGQYMYMDLAVIMVTITATPRRM